MGMGTQLSSGTGTPFGVSQGGYGAYQTNPNGTIQGIGVNTTPTQGQGRGGVFTVDPYTGRISAIPSVGMSWGAPGSGINNPAYGMGMAPNQIGSTISSGQLGMGNNQRQGITSESQYPVQTGPGGQQFIQRPDFYGTMRNFNIGNNMTGGTGQVSGTAGAAGAAGAGGANAGLEGLAAMGQRRLGEQASEQNERLAEDYQRRGMTQSGLLGEAQARQTRDQGYALADFLAQLYGRQSGNMFGVNALSAQNRDDGGSRGPTGMQDLQQAYANVMQGQQIDPSLQQLLAQLFGGGGGGTQQGGYTDASGLYTDPLVAAMTGARAGGGYAGGRSGGDYNNNGYPDVWEGAD
jgi:cytochrome c1